MGLAVQIRPSYFDVSDRGFPWEAIALPHTFTLERSTLPLSPSPILVVVTASVLTAGLCSLALLPIPWELRLVLGAALVVMVIRSCRSAVLQRLGNSIVALELHADGELEVVEKNGLRLPAIIAPDSVIFPFLVVLRVRVAGEGAARSATVLADATRPEAHRRLRVWLQWIATTGNDVVA